MKSKVSNGVKQRGNLSSNFFNIYIDGLLQLLYNSINCILCWCFGICKQCNKYLSKLLSLNKMLEV